ncbi:hypothetical protein PG989_001918 [Apiospora arundinis]
MADSKIMSADDAETFMAKVFDILDSYDYDRLSEIFAVDLQYEGGLQSSLGLENFIRDLKESMKKMPGIKTSHSRYKNEITSEGTIYSFGHSTALFESHPDKPVTVPMMGFFRLVLAGPENGKIKEMRVYKDRLPFYMLHQQLPGMQTGS